MCKLPSSCWQEPLEDMLPAWRKRIEVIQEAGKSKDCQIQMRDTVLGRKGQKSQCFLLFCGSSNG